MNAKSHHIAHRIAGPSPGYSRVRVLAGNLLWGLLLVLVCLGSASSDANTPPPGQLVASFVYNPSGLRIEKQGERGVERFTYDEQSLLQAYDENNTTLAKYDYGAERLVSLTSSSEPVQFYLTDALNSVVNLTNTAGSVQARYQYDAFGNQRAQSGSSYNRFAFTGYVEDKETDLLYAKARYYDSDTGRFLSQDAWEGQNDLPPSLHKYLYAYQNPTVYVDPTGNYAELPLEIASVGMGLHSAYQNITEGNYGEAAVDAAFVVVDIAGMALPAAPGVAGAARQAGKAGLDAVDSANDARKAADNTNDVRKAEDKAGKTDHTKSEATVTRESDASPAIRQEESARVGDVGAPSSADLSQAAIRARVEANISTTRAGNSASKFDEFVLNEGRLQERLDIWPPNMGRIGQVETIDLQPGFIMDRFGLPNGRFLSPQGVPFTNRALPSGYESSKPYFLYEVVKPIPGVTQSRALPWFGQDGMGLQLELPRGINYLDPNNGYVKVRHREQ